MSDLTWEFDEEKRLLTAVFHGTLRFETVLEFWNVLANLGHDPTDILAIVDARDADLSSLTAEDFKTMEGMRQGGAVPTGRAAAVVGHDRDLGIARLWAAFRNESAPGSTAVFTDKETAIAWLFDADAAEP